MAEKFRADVPAKPARHASAPPSDFRSRSLEREHDRRVKRIAPEAFPIDGDPAGQRLVRLNPEDEVPRLSCPR